MKWSVRPILPPWSVRVSMRIGTFSEAAALEAGAAGAGAGAAGGFPPEAGTSAASGGGFHGGGGGGFHGGGAAFHSGGFHGGGADDPLEARRAVGLDREITGESGEAEPRDFQEHGVESRLHPLRREGLPAQEVEVRGLLDGGEPGHAGVARIGEARLAVGPLSEL